VRGEDQVGAREDVRTGLVVLAGLLFLLAGVLQAAGFFPLAFLGLRSAVALAILTLGAVLLILGLARVRHGGAALLLAISACVLMITASGLMALVTPAPRLYTHVREITTADVGAVSELALSVDVDVGALELYTTENRSLLVRVEFLTVKGASFSFGWSSGDGVLRAEASAPSASVRVFVADWLPWTLRARTGVGAVSGQVNATFLKELRVRTATGSVELSIWAEEPALNATATNATVVAETSMGSVELAVSTGPEVGCLVQVQTALGSVDHEEEGYEVLSEERGRLVLRSEGYEEASAYLSISAKTALGSVEVRAERRA